MSVAAAYDRQQHQQADHDGEHWPMMAAMLTVEGIPTPARTAVHLAPPAFKDVNMSMLKRADTARRRDGLAKFTVVRR